MSEPQIKRQKTESSQKKYVPYWHFDMMLAKRIVLDGKYVTVETEGFDKTRLTENKDFTIEDDLILYKNTPQCKVAPSNLPKLVMKYKLKIKTGEKRVLYDKPFYIIKTNNYDSTKINEPYHKFGSNHSYECLDADLKTWFSLKFCRHGEYHYVIQNYNHVEQKFDEYDSDDDNYVALPELKNTDTRKIILSIHAPTDHQQFYSDNKSNFVTVNFRVGTDRPNQSYFRNKRGMPLGIVLFSCLEVFPASAWVTTVPKYKKRVEKITEHLDYKSEWGIPLLLPVSDDDVTNNIDSDDADDN